MLQAAIEKLMRLTKPKSKKKSEPAREPTKLEKARIERAKVYHNGRRPGSYDTTLLDTPIPYHNHSDFTSQSSSDDCSSSSCCDSSFSCD